MKGDQGDQGDKGIGVANALVDANGDLQLTYTEGQHGECGVCDWTRKVTKVLEVLEAKWDLMV